MSNTQVVVSRNGNIEYGVYAEVCHEGSEWVVYNVVTGMRRACVSKQAACIVALGMMRHYARLERCF